MLQILYLLITIRSTRNMYMKDYQKVNFRVKSILKIFWDPFVTRYFSIPHFLNHLVLVVIYYWGCISQILDRVELNTAKYYWIHTTVHALQYHPVYFSNASLMSALYYRIGQKPVRSTMHCSLVLCKSGSNYTTFIGLNPNIAMFIRPSHRGCKIIFF